MMSEAILHEQVADYLRLQYPDVMFHSDYGSGIKLTIGQAVKQKRLNGGRRSWPDIFIARKKIMRDYSWNGMPRGSVYCGLFIELKKEGERLYRKSGEFATEHIKDQWGVLNKLKGERYCAEFAVGFGAAKELIDGYLGEDK